MTSVSSCRCNQVIENSKSLRCMAGTRLSGVSTCARIGLQRSQGRSLQLQVCAAKGKKLNRSVGKQGEMPSMATPPLDPENEEFVIFVRNPQIPIWVPVNIVNGGSAANFLVKSLTSEWGKKLYGNSLIRNIGLAIYREKPKLEKYIQKNIPTLKYTKEFEYGFKIRDKSNPKLWYTTDNITVLPKQKDLADNPLDAIQKAFANAFKGSS